MNSQPWQTSIPPLVLMFTHNCSKFYLQVHFECAQFFTTGHIVIALAANIQNVPDSQFLSTLGSHDSKHSECAQFLTSNHIVARL